jgi:hypothetical protein
MNTKAADRLRSRAVHLLKVLMAHAWIVAPPDPAEIKRLNQYTAAIDAASKKELYRILERIEKRIEQIRTEYSITAPASYLLQILEVMFDAPVGRLTLMPLYLWRRLFKGSKYPWSGMEVWPLHARIGLDVSGLVYAETRSPEVFLLEAMLFEDAASMFNAAKRELARHQGGRVKDKPSFKLANALCRGATTAAVYFVEAYVNGIAIDHIIEHEKEVDESTRSVLLDWDFTRKRPRYLALKDKVLQYQRIILGVPHAPIQESNCPAMTTILGTARIVRDAIAHPSPALDLTTLEAAKERAIFGLGFDQVEAVVDAAIQLVKDLDKAISGKPDRLFWLHERGSDGFFPEVAFT